MVKCISTQGDQHKLREVWGYINENITGEELNVHKQAKQKARDCKSADKELAKREASVSCWTMDLQAVL
jgi:hypothetical protein